jgi:hypothetical protein
MILITASAIVLMLLVAMIDRGWHVNVNRPARLVFNAILWRA